MFQRPTEWGAQNNIMSQVWWSGCSYTVSSRRAKRQKPESHTLHPRGRGVCALPIQPWRPEAPHIY